MSGQRKMRGRPAHLPALTHAHAHADDPMYGHNSDLSPIPSMHQSLFSSTQNMFRILRPLDAGNGVSSPPPESPLQTAFFPSTTDPWPAFEDEVKLEDLPDLVEGCRLLDTYETARTNIQQFSGSDHVDDQQLVFTSQHLLLSKPALTFPSMMTLAILDSSAKKLTVSEIYKWIKSTFPFFDTADAGAGWKNSVRHNLSLNSHFKRVSRETDKSPASGRAERSPATGKGSFWALKSASLIHLEQQLTDAMDTSKSAMKFRAAIKQAKLMADIQTPTNPIISPSKLSSTDGRRRKRSGKAKAVRQQRELDAIAHTLLSLKTANAKGFRGKPLPAIKTTTPMSAQGSSVESTITSRGASGIVTGRYDPNARIPSSRQDETEFVVVQSPDQTMVRRSRVASNTSSLGVAQTEDPNTPGMFTFTSPMSLSAGPNWHSRSYNSTAHRHRGGDDALLSMDNATEDELSATAALLSLAGVHDVNFIPEHK